MKLRITPLIACICFLFTHAHAQTKVLGECTIQFDIQEQRNSEWVNIGTKKILVKGNQCKTVLTTNQLVQTLIFNTQNNKAIVTKELGESKFLQEIMYPSLAQPALVSMKQVLSDSAIIIQGYLCRTLIMQWSDGTTYEVNYTPEVIPSVNVFELAFKEVPGLVLSYSISSSNGRIVKYSASEIDLSPITLNQFEVNRLLFQILE